MVSNHHSHSHDCCDVVTHDRPPKGGLAPTNPLLAKRRYDNASARLWRYNFVHAQITAQNLIVFIVVVALMLRASTSSMHHCLHPPTAPPPPAPACCCYSASALPSVRNNGPMRNVSSCSPSLRCSELQSARCASHDCRHYSILTPLSAFVFST